MEDAKTGKETAMVLESDVLVEIHNPETSGQLSGRGNGMAILVDHQEMIPASLWLRFLRWLVL
jgi:hypothetical protein